MQARNYCFTFNNPTVADVTILMQVVGQLISYICWGHECGSKGTVHLQGYLECTRPTRIGALQKLGVVFSKLLPRRGTQDEAINYTQKDGMDTWFEYGVRKANQEVTKSNLKQARLINIKRHIHNGATEDEIFEIDPVIAVQHTKWIEKELMKRKRVRKEDLKVLLYYGKPGTGKTKRAYDQYEDIYALPIGKDLWFNNYREEPDVLLDDFSGQMRLVDTLRLLDRYPIQVPIKGGFVWWCPTTIIITTNQHPKDWYKYEERKDSEEALKRRIHGVLNFDIPNPITGQPFQCQQVAEFWP